MRILLLTASIAALLLTGPLRAAVQYPLLLTFDAQATSGVTTITSKVTVRVERSMDNILRTQVTDALRFGGYATFVLALRPLPQLGTVETQSTTVAIRYAREDPDGAGSRLVLVGDRPLFFFGADPARSRAGFDLTLLDLRIDAQGGVTGQLIGAARVRPAPDGSVLVDTYAETPVQVKGQLARP